MKNLAILSVWATTTVLLALFVAAFFDTPFKVMIILCLSGSLLVPVMVYLVLTDSYKTDLTFDDWYLDNPKKK